MMVSVCLLKSKSFWMLFQAAVVIVKCAAKGPEKLIKEMEGSGMK